MLLYCIKIIMKEFEKYWREHGQFLDYVNKNLDKKEELKDFARQIYKYNINKIRELEDMVNVKERIDKFISEDGSCV